MAQNAMPWTVAMEEYLVVRTADAEWVSKDEVLAVGSAAVSEEVALKEMSKRPSRLSEEKRMAAGRHSKATQALMGFRRFGKILVSADGKSVQWVGEAHSLGAVAARVALLESLAGQVEALEAQVQFLVDRLTGESQTSVEEFFAAAGFVR